MGGVTPLQHRVKIGCFAGMSSSSRWSPSSSGKSGSSHSFNVRAAPSSRTKNSLSFLLLFIKVLSVALPFMMMTFGTSQTIKVAEAGLVHVSLNVYQVRELKRKI
jgi:hypothetical protein